MRKWLILAMMFAFLLPTSLPAQVLVGGGNIRFTPKGAAPVFFNHERHVAANGRSCSGCHFGVFQMEKGSHRMNMSKITKGHFCGTCHNGRNAFDVESKASCKRCHQ